MAGALQGTIMKGAKRQDCCRFHDPPAYGSRLLRPIHTGAVSYPHTPSITILGLVKGFSCEGFCPTLKSVG